MKKALESHRTIMQVITLVSDCVDCPHFKKNSPAGDVNDGGNCSILDIPIIKGYILADCPFEELSCPDHHSHELI